MAFKDMRRQKFLSESHANERDDDLTFGIRRYTERVGNPDLREEARRKSAWMAATYSLELVILRYTAGRPIEELSRELPSVIEAFDRYVPFNKPRPNEARSLEITQIEAYVYVTWLLALCKLLGHAESVPKVLAWLDIGREFSRGRDTLFEQIVGKLTGAMEDPGRYILHLAPYAPLGKAVIAEHADDRPALVKEFLDGWYKGLKECYWHGTHTDQIGYFGYWAFEAALVTVLWDIDDSSYRDHLVYPKDLVDWARDHRTEAVPSGPSRTPGGQACPQAGWWFTPALKGSRRYFKHGEVMPVIDGTDYGSTFWQWDVNQSAPKL
ncbi:PoNe immunity protein domain-containing protein [Variovorax paradoxus]|uniref:DUF1911 domain-containing protein n=1 Tax=Variovorax paradoxus (strain EPS) TaxID=595537 RepID=E6VAD2_VARPE|nr:PoNe immunity protein domain-containing protein [Variovorax paradoxus]ADU39676.1 Domain of unknown function DUF1911 [Variovorax paradoxus EPS]